MKPAKSSPQGERGGEGERTAGWESEGSGIDYCSKSVGNKLKLGDRGGGETAASRTKLQFGTNAFFFFFFLHLCQINDVQV